MTEHFWFAKYLVLKASIIIMLTKIQLKTQKKNDGICCHDNVEFLSIGQKK